MEALFAPHQPPGAPPPLGEPGSDARAAATFAVYEQHRDFVWRTLQRLGAHGAIDDLFQEVFIVVHQRLHSYEGAGTLSSWLYGICVRVVSAHRRRAHVRRESPSATLGDELVGGPSPEGQAESNEARATVHHILDQLDPEKRAVLVMFELEQLSCQDIAAQLGVPLGTVYSRLHAARATFQREAERWSRKRSRGG